MRFWMMIAAAAVMLGGCAKVFRTAEPATPQIFKKRYEATPNDLYYALRWALKTYGYPIAEEDLQNGILKSRYVPVKATSHYVAVFGRKDYGVTGAYHQLEVRLLPAGAQTEVQIGSRIQGVVSKLQSSGREEKMIFAKVGDYLRDPNIQVTNQGVGE